MTIAKTWFCNMVHSYQSDLYRLAFHILKNKEDAEDAVQETLYRAYSSLGTLANPKYFKTWVIRILMNTAFEIQRKRKNNVDITDCAEIASQPEDITTAVMLEKAINGLDEKYRTIILLYYYENYSAKEISEILNISAMNVKQRLSRSRKMLKGILSGHGKGV